MARTKLSARKGRVIVVRPPPQPQARIASKEKEDTATSRIYVINVNRPKQPGIRQVNLVDPCPTELMCGICNEIIINAAQCMKGEQVVFFPQRLRRISIQFFACRF